MGLFDATHQVFRKMSGDFDSIIVRTKASSGDPVLVPYKIENTGKGEVLDPALLADSGQQASGGTTVSAMEHVRDFVGHALACANQRVCERMRSPSLLEVCQGEAPGELSISVNRAELSTRPDVRINSRMIARELNQMEKLVFSGWQNVKVGGASEGEYLAKQFKPADEELAEDLIKCMGRAYGLDAQTYEGSANDGSRVLMVKKTLLDTLAQKEATAELDYDSPIDPGVRR